MNDWVSLLKEFVWPIFWAIVLLSARKPLGHLFKAVQERIVAGAEFEAGATGIKVGAAPKLSEVSPTSLSVEPTTNTSDSQQLVEHKSSASPSQVRFT
jgi:hypothetical protein